MNLRTAKDYQIKSYIASLMARHAAICGHFATADYENIRGEPLAAYVRDVAELVELSRLAQEALSLLIHTEEVDIQGDVSELDGAIPEYYPQLNDVQRVESAEWRQRFLELMHMGSGTAHFLAATFNEHLLNDGESTSAKSYARCRAELAALHEMSLVAQIALSHLLRIANRYRNGQ